MALLQQVSICLKNIPKRFIVVFMAFLTLVSLQAMGSSLPLTMTQMVNSNVFAVMEHSEDSCPMRSLHKVNESSDSDEEFSKRFEWSEELQGIILGSLYIGYVIFQIPGGLLAGRIGGKPIIVTALSFTCFLTLCTPFLVTAGGANALIVVRVIIGGLQGASFVSILTITSLWVPTRERGRLGALVFCGIPCGTIISNFVSGLLLDAYHNWHVVFYTFGVLGAVVAVLFHLLCSSNPNTHPFITEAEKHYLQSQMGQLDRKSLPTPWKVILTSKPVLALLLDLCLGNWAFFVVLIDLPKYMNDIIHVSVKENGIYSSLPWAMRILVSLLVGPLSDWLISSGRLSITNTRKLYVFLGSTIDGIFILAAAYAGCNEMLVGAFFTLAVGSQGFFATSSLVNSMDLSPNFSGVIAGITNGLGSLTGVAVPWVVGVFTANSLRSEWLIVFWITFWVEMLKIINFCLFGSGEVQPWNNVESKENHKIESELGQRK